MWNKYVVFFFSRLLPTSLSSANRTHRPAGSTDQLTRSNVPVTCGASNQSVANIRESTNAKQKFKLEVEAKPFTRKVGSWVFRDMVFLYKIAMNQHRPGQRLLARTAMCNYLEG